MSNAEMYQLLLAAMTQHKEEIKKLVQQSELHCKVDEEKFEKEKTIIGNIKDITDQCVLDKVEFCNEISDLKDRVRCLKNLVVRQDAKITELQDRNEKTDT